ncbi:MAG: hypothetical protein ACHQ2F_04660 [Desulfobaccales bacterium]
MKSKFFRPHVIWLGVWLAIFFAMLLIAAWQNDLYWRGDLAKFSQLELVTVERILPYALAYLKEHQQPEALQKIIEDNLGPYALVITDKAGNIQYAPSSVPAGKLDSSLLKGNKFFYLLKNPDSRRSLSGPYTDGGTPAVTQDQAESLGRLYLIDRESYSLKETLGQAYGKILTPSESVFAFTLLSYIMVLVGFAGICAISARFQSHFQQVQEKQYETELETRELRIQVLESDISAADLRLELLDRRYEQAQAVMNATKIAIAGLEKTIQYESSRNEELGDSLRQAEAERDEALATMQAIDQDRGKIAQELKELEVLKEVEEMNRPESAKEKARRPREFLWLNMVYKNLYFSRQALQNIIDLQNSSDVFPALPDALAALNGSSVESLASGGALPPRSVVRYSQPLVHHRGDFWEYRFSKDGRLFFGLSKSKTWNIDTILLKRKFTLNRYKYEKHLEQTLGKDNNDLISPN